MEANKNKPGFNSRYKFLVLKTENMNEALDSIEFRRFLDLYNKVIKYRTNKGKIDANEYAVINVDESYSSKVVGMD